MSTLAGGSTLDEIAIRLNDFMKQQAAPKRQRQEKHWAMQIIMLPRKKHQPAFQ